MDNTAAIIGAGLIGRSWAMVFARAGWRVRLYDAAPAQLDAARTFIATSLAEQARHGLVAVSPADLDKTVRDGLGLRWSFLGPFATIELNAPLGGDDYRARYSSFFRRLLQDPPSAQAWDDANAARVAAALGPPAASTDIERRMRWRDRRLMALVAHKKEQSASETKE